MTPGVERVIEALDAERLAVARTFGHELLPLVHEMAEIGTVEPGSPVGDVAAAIRAGSANRSIKGPDSTQHRYYREDFPFGLQPFVALANVAESPAPVARSLLALGSTVLGVDVMAGGRTAEAIGVADMSAAALLDLVRA